MAKRAFDLSEFAASLGADVSKSDTSAPEVRMIDLDDILDNKGNFYAVGKDGLGSLADSIAMDGLQQYPVVMVHPTEAGRYLLISGHRRCAALRLLVEEGREDLRRVPCTVRSYASPALAEFSLIVANATARVLSPAEVGRQAARMEELLYQLKEEGYEFPGRMRDVVAKACQVSAPKLARLKVIREKLYADWLYYFERNELSEQAAYALARMPVELQSRLATVLKDGAIYGAAAENILTRSQEGWTWEPALTCPDGKACRHGDTFLRHDAEHSVEMCGGRTCCLECPRVQTSWYPCNRMCSRAKALRKEGQDEKKAAEADRKRANSDRYKAETQVNAQRLVPVLAMAVVTGGDTISWRSYRPPIKIAVIRDWANGVFDPDEIWTEPELVPEQGDSRALARIARQFGCSTDYLMGLTDNLTLTENVEAPETTAEDILEQTKGESTLLRWRPISDPPLNRQHIFARIAASGYYLAGYWRDGLHDLTGCVMIAMPEDIVAWMPIPAEDEVYMLLEGGGRDG